MNDFYRAVDFVIDELEGGGKVVADSGGVTKWGISSRAHPTLNVVDLNRDEAIQVYQMEYWKPADCEELSWPFSLVVFDCAVNQGLAVALQVATNNFDHLEALWDRADRYAHIAEHNPSERQYFRGWMNRLLKIWKFTKGS